MTFEVEDGTGLADANSYVSVDDADEYFSDRGSTVWSAGSTDSKQAALVRATEIVDAVYRNRFPGTRTNARAQALEWPRVEATDSDGNVLEKNELPIEIVNATNEIAVRELAEPNSVLPDLERGGAIRRVKAGSVEVEYGANASEVTIFQLINGIMSGLVGGGLRPSMFGVAARG